MVNLANGMSSIQNLEKSDLDIRPEAIREQLELLVKDPAFRTSRRSVQFLRYVVEQTLQGAAEQIKERTIGVEVFGREPSYDTATDHVVRTAAVELRKRLAVYYNDERHRSELRMSFVSGSYVPRFMLPSQAENTVRDFEDSVSSTESSAGFRTTLDLDDQHVASLNAGEAHREGRRRFWLAALAILLIVIGVWVYRGLRPPDPVSAFWSPLTESPGPVLLGVGDILNGEPKLPGGNQEQDAPLLPKGLSSNVPYADAVTVARVLSVLQLHGKTVIMRPEVSTSFSDFRDNPAVLIGAFNNEWSLRLTHALRFSLAFDPDHHLIYIRDAKNPTGRAWSQLMAPTFTQQFDRGAPPRQDYALITRVFNPQTGHVLVVVGGLYAYGTQAAGEFITNRSMMESVARLLPLKNPRSTIQIVLKTDVTDDTPGVAKVLAVSTE
jgi:hypothetical protein